MSARLGRHGIEEGSLDPQGPADEGATVRRKHRHLLQRGHVRDGDGSWPFRRLRRQVGRCQDELLSLSRPFWMSQLEVLTTVQAVGHTSQRLDARDGGLTRLGIALGDRWPCLPRSP